MLFAYQASLMPCSKLLYVCAEMHCYDIGERGVVRRVVYRRLGSGTAAAGLECSIPAGGADSSGGARMAGGIGGAAGHWRRRACDRARCCCVCRSHDELARLDTDGRRRMALEECCTSVRQKLQGLYTHSEYSERKRLPGRLHRSRV